MQPTIPSTGFLRERDIIGCREITPEEAAANRAAGRRGRRPRAAQPALIPICSASLWRAVNAGTFPRPIKLFSGVTAWRVEDVHEWLAAQGAKQ